MSGCRKQQRNFYLKFKRKKIKKKNKHDEKQIEKLCDLIEFAKVKDGRARDGFIFFLHIFFAVVG